MDALEAALRVAAVACLLLALALVVVILLFRRERRAREDLLGQVQQLDSQKRSQSTRYGQITEQFAPFMADWPWDPKRFKFLGDPIDGVQFTDQGIVFVEIKTASSRLSPVQQQAKALIQAGHVYWHEHRIG